MGRCAAAPLVHAAPRFGLVPTDKKVVYAGRQIECARADTPIRLGPAPRVVAKAETAAQLQATRAIDPGIPTGVALRRAGSGIQSKTAYITIVPDNAS